MTKRENRRYWLTKSEPKAFSLEDLKNAKNRTSQKIASSEIAISKFFDTAPEEIKTSQFNVSFSAFSAIIKT